MESILQYTAVVPAARARVRVPARAGTTPDDHPRPE
jgi:hypothetical protein